MAKSNTAQLRNKAVYPLSVSIGIFVAAVALSFVDLLFLSEVIGKVLDLDTLWSMLISFGLGLVGIAVMTSYGIQLAHGNNSKASAIGHYVLWIALGIIFVLIRLWSAMFLGLGTEAGDEKLISLFGLVDVREVDLIMAPLMLLLYIATGIMAKDAAKNLFLNPDFDKWNEERKLARKNRKTKEEKAREKAEREQQARLEKAAKDAEEARLAMKNGQAKAELAKTYDQALRAYNQKLEEIKSNYQTISANIDYIHTIDKQERQFEANVKPSFKKIIQGSVEGVQNSVALAIHAKNKGDIQALRNEIEIHKSTRR